MGAEVYLSIGSNLGDRKKFLLDVVDELKRSPNVTALQASSIYETEPVGVIDQPRFLNMVVRLRTFLSPHALLQWTSQIEKEFGRTRDVRWGPRTLDLDILLYNQETIDTPSLQIPHPRMLKRAFVMIPLFELTGKDFLLPCGITMEEALQNTPGIQGVHKVLSLFSS